MLSPNGPRTWGKLTSVRGTGSHIAGTNGESQRIPFKMHNDHGAVNQGGKEKARCAYLESWHCDILEFLEFIRILVTIVAEPMI